LSKSSHVPVRFDGGPRSGQSTELAGEPPRLLAVRERPGHYALAWDRDDNGVRLRSGVYTWKAASGDDLVEPTSGDEASALLAHAKDSVTVKDGASISPVPDLTTSAAEPKAKPTQAPEPKPEPKPEPTRKPATPARKPATGSASSK
jgi:hypothetical protein